MVQSVLYAIMALYAIRHTLCFYCYYIIIVRFYVLVSNVLVHIYLMFFSVLLHALCIFYVLVKSLFCSVC